MFVSMNLPNLSGEGGSFSSSGRKDGQWLLDHRNHQLVMQQGVAANDEVSSSKKTTPPVKKKRNLPGTPDPSAEVIALSPTTLMARNRFVCEICNKGFQRDQNLQLHRRGHNLPWKLRQREGGGEASRKRVYVCPEATCVHHDPRRALGDLTGIKKHYCRKHGEKKWRCTRCGKRYAVQSDWKAHSKTCGTREYKCDCGTIFSRRDSFITHRAFCDALTEESNRVAKQQAFMDMTSSTGLGSATANVRMVTHQVPPIISSEPPVASDNGNGAVMVGSISASSAISGALNYEPELKINNNNPMLTFRPPFTTSTSRTTTNLGPMMYPSAAVVDPAMNTATPWSAATALLQKAAQMGATSSGDTGTNNSCYYHHLPYYHLQQGRLPHADFPGFPVVREVAPGLSGVGLFPAQEGTSTFEGPTDFGGGNYAPRNDGGTTMTVDFLARRTQ